MVGIMPHSRLCSGISSMPLPHSASHGGQLSRLTTLWQAAGNDEGFEVKVIDEEQEVGDGESEEAKSKELEGNEL